MTIWEETFKSLQVPAQYASFQNLHDDTGALKSLDTWRNNVHLALNTLRDLIIQKQATGEPIDSDALANIVFYVSPFALESEDDDLNCTPWSNESTHGIAVGELCAAILLPPESK